MYLREIPDDELEKLATMLRHSAQQIHYNPNGISPLEVITLSNDVLNELATRKEGRLMVEEAERAVRENAASRIPARH